MRFIAKDVEAVTLLSLLRRRSSTASLKTVSETYEFESTERSTNPSENYCITFTLLPIYLLSVIHESIAILLTVIYRLLFSKCLPKLSDAATRMRGGVSKFYAKRTLLFLSLDLISDIYTGAHHLHQGRIAEGILTFSIILGSGIIVSTIVGISTKRRENYLKHSKLYTKLGRLLWIPGFMPFYSGIIRLDYAKELSKYASEKEHREILDAYYKFEIDSSWDAMFETIYESFPQALLQIVVLLEKPEVTFKNDWLVVTGILISIYGIANGPLNLQAVNNKIDSEPLLGDVLITALAKVVSLFAFSLMIISSRIWIPNHRIMAVLLALFLLFLFLDIPFLIIDGWVGRYTPDDRNHDKNNGLASTHPNSRLARKHRLLKRAYVAVDIIYITVAVLALATWVVTDYFTVGITRRVYVIGGIYSVALIITVTTLLKKGTREAVCCCIPYFLGPFIVRCIRYYYKKTGRVEKFGSEDYIHSYIGC